ncbi:hypothetical protein QZH41_006724 [Actinostola sp. cb2023]|nr:hypothetical protein QZH41_006724 [Actinostola sp. cb2023]
MDSSVKYLITIAVGVIALILVIVLPLSFSDVEYYEIAFKKQKSTGKVDTSKVYTMGRYAIGPDYTFKKFRADAHFELLQKIGVFTKDKTEVEISCAFQYFLKPEDLEDLHQQYDLFYKPVVRSTANAAIKGIAADISISDYLRKRESVQKTLFKTVADRLGGKCCRKDCKAYKCRTGCTPYASCKKEDKGVFVEVRYFQLLDFDLHNDVKSRYLRQVTEREQEEEANFKLQEKIVRKETDRLINELHNEAHQLSQNSTAQATIIMAKAEADALVKISFKKQKSTGKVDLTRVYTSGRYLIGPDYTFKAFRADAHFELLKDITTYSDDKVEVTISCAFQYFLKPEDLSYLHQEYDLYYRPVMKSTANAVIKSIAAEIPVGDFIRQRDSVENKLWKAVADRLGGKCCRKDCKAYKCRTGCTPYASCKKEDKGVFIEVRYFQLLDFDIHNDVKSRYLRQVIEREQEEEANFELREKVVRKETDRLRNEINNEAKEITQNSTAQATIIMAKADADALVKVEEARNTGLSQVFTSLGISDESHKASYIYLTALRRQSNARLNINYNTLMARD